MQQRRWRPPRPPPAANVTPWWSWSECRYCDSSNDYCAYPPGGALLEAMCFEIWLAFLIALALAFLRYGLR